jgi:hypothetical protein
VRREKRRNGKTRQLKAGLDRGDIIFNSRNREVTEMKKLNEREQNRNSDRRERKNVIKAKEGQGKGGQAVSRQSRRAV